MVGVLGVEVAAGVWGDDGVVLGDGVAVAPGVSLGVAVFEGVSLVGGVTTGRIGSALASPVRRKGLRTRRRNKNRSRPGTCRLTQVGEGLLGSRDDLHPVEDQLFVLKVNDH